LQVYSLTNGIQTQAGAGSFLSGGNGADGKEGGGGGGAGYYGGGGIDVLYIIYIKCCFNEYLIEF
jgi:hypothetical protein